MYFLKLIIYISNSFYGASAKFNDICSHNEIFVYQFFVSLKITKISIQSFSYIFIQCNNIGCWSGFWRDQLDQYCLSQFSETGSCRFHGYITWCHLPSISYGTRIGVATPMHPGRTRWKIKRKFSMMTRVRIAR